MSRGGGRGGFRSRGGAGGFGGGAAALPMGLSHADLQSLSREGTALYPVCLIPQLCNPRGGADI